MIQSPDVFLNGGHPDYNRNLLKAYANSVAIQDIDDFILRVQIEVASRCKRVSTLVIGSHGYVSKKWEGAFYIGKNRISDDVPQNINLLGRLRNFFVQDADVYILACRTGLDRGLLRKVSTALGGVAVHGYTNWIMTTGLGLGASVDTQVGDTFETNGRKNLTGKHVICWPSVCVHMNFGQGGAPGPKRPL